MAFMFVSASERELSLFKNQNITSGNDSACAVMCNIGTLMMLVNSAICSICHNRSLSVLESVGKLKGLPLFLEMHCRNCNCPMSIPCLAYMSKCVVAGEASVQSRAMAAEAHTTAL